MAPGGGHSRLPPGTEAGAAIPNEHFAQPAGSAIGPFQAAAPGTLADRYLDLLKRTLTDSLWLDRPLANASPYDYSRDKKAWRRGLVRLAARLLRTRGIELVKDYNPGDLAARQARRAVGQDWPARGDSMIGWARLDNLRMAIETVLAEGIPGHLIETGVWRGGACIFMRGVLQAYGVSDREVWLADSFEGLPPPEVGGAAADRGDRHHEMDALRVGLEEVQANFRRYGLLDDRVRFLKGWFEDTLASAPIDRLAVLRLDGDMYSSTMTALHALYDRVSPGGFVIVDDYGAVKGCAQAITDFRAGRDITAPLVPIDWAGVYWRKA
ncbi:TylF/MycF family methyltransferase [Zavarzinia sp. CC-PAN008]|uniref:TylF/MycF family methyltransferase n=1 Tax=Zavarzinia sp. CC-PAN008 TaxID=3243332 RepID=UPI003F744BF6